MPPAAILRPNYRALMAPGLNVIFNTSLLAIQEQISPIFKIMPSKKAFETELGMIGLGAPGLVAEFDIPKYDAPALDRPVQYVHNKYGLGVQISKEAYDDDQYGLLAKSIAPALARSFERERNTQAATILSNGFNVNGYEFDGVPLFSANHPLPRGGVQSNVLTTPLSVAGLQAARTRLRKNLAPDGVITPLMPKYLIVGPSLESLADELILSAMKPGQTGTGAGLVTTPSEVNIPAQRGLTKVVLDYLPDRGEYFVAAGMDDRMFKWYDRQKPETDDDWDKEAQALKYYCFARWSFGFSDFRGIVGYPPSS